MTVDSILEKIQYNYDDIDNDFNEYTYLTSREYNVLINEYKNNNNIKAYNFLYANSFVIYKSIYYKRYHNSMYGLKTKDSYNEEDVLQDFIFCFLHVLNKYQDIGEASSYSSYVSYHYRYYLTELIRNKYFQVLKVPQKESRKQETRVYKYELFEDTQLIEEELNIIDNMYMESKYKELINEMNNMINKKKFNEKDLDMFKMFYGISYDKEYKLKEISEKYNISINTVYYRITKVSTVCKSSIKFKEAYNDYLKR